MNTIHRCLTTLPVERNVTKTRHSNFGIDIKVFQIRIVYFRYSVDLLCSILTRMGIPNSIKMKNSESMLSLTLSFNVVFLHFVNFVLLTGFKVLLLSKYLQYSAQISPVYTKIYYLQSYKAIFLVRGLIFSKFSLNSIFYSFFI